MHGNDHALKRSLKATSTRSSGIIKKITVNVYYETSCINCISACGDRLSTRSVFFCFSLDEHINVIDTQYLPMINKTDREIKIHTDQGTCYGHMV